MTQKQPIKKPLIINNVNLSLDNSLLTLATNKGYQIYNSLTHKKISFYPKAGALSFANTFYKSQLIFFIGTETNKVFQPTKFVIWDDSKKKKKGILELKTLITNCFVSDNIIFLFTKETLLLFELTTLSYINSFTNLYYHKNSKTYSITPLNAIAFITKDEISKVKIRLFELADKKKINVRKIDIQTNFNFIQGVHLSDNLKYLAAITFLGNKVHVYEVKSKNLAMCFFLGNIMSTIRHISFDLKEKYLLILRNEAEEFGKLSLLKIENFKKECDCDKHNDNDVLEKEKNKEERNFFSLWIDEMKDKFFSSEKGDLMYDEIDVNNVKNIIYINFNKICKNEIEFIESNGAYKKVKFDRKINNKMHYIKSIW